MPLTIFFSSPGTYTIDDDGIRGNNTSVVRDSSGTVLFPFTHPGDTIDFIAEVPGITFIFNTADSFGTANVTAGSLTNPALSPESIIVRSLRTDAFATLVATGTIVEGGEDAAADLTAAGLILSAGSGVGTAANAIETQVTFIEAETTTGGINLANAGSVQVGGLTPDVAGLNVATSGNINFTNTGFILLADGTGASSVHGGDASGNVTLTALGADSDIFSNIDQRVVQAAGGGITLNAGRDVIFGTSGTNFNNDLLATGPVTITAGRDFQLDGTSDIRTGAFGGVLGGQIAINAGRNINLSNTTGGLQTIQAFSGDVLLTTGPGGVFFELAAFPGAVQTTNDIVVVADTVQIGSGGLNTTGIGSITIRPATPGRAIDLGSALDGPAFLGLSDDEFDLLFSLNVSIGSAATGPITVSAPLSPFIVDNLTLQTGTDIVFNSTLSLPRRLSLLAGDDIHFAPTSSFSSANDSLVAVVDNAQADDKLGGFGSLGGTLTVAVPISLSGNLDADTLSGSGADDMLMGYAGNDILRGFGGADSLIGGIGTDTMAGGLGGDSYLVEDTGDIVTELAGEGTDTVYTTISYGLAAGASIEVLSPYDRLTTNAMNLLGNAENQTIYGNNGVNQLAGNGGTDVFYGLNGNDSYIVDGMSDQVFEAAGQGADTVYAIGNHTLVAGQSIETLSVFDRTTTNAINLGGNNFGQTIYGNNGVNALIGGGGTDTFFGMGGNDGFIVDDMSDVVFEFAGGGTDTVYTTASYALGAGAAVETLTVYNRLTTNAINLLGNELGQTIFGNDGANIIDGKSGADSISLLGGADAVRFTTALGGGNVDAVLGFATGIDKIQLDRVIFTGLAPGALPAGVLVVGALPSDANDRLLYNQVSGQLFFDADGNGAGAAVLFATFDPGTVLATNDFVVL